VTGEGDHFSLVPVIGERKTTRGSTELALGSGNYFGACP